MSSGLRRRPGVVMLAVCGLLLTSCGPSASPSSSPSLSPTASSAEPEAQSPETADCLAPPTVCDGPLPAGDYVSDGTGAHVTFSLDEHDWSGSQDQPGEGFALFLADIPDGGIYVVRFDGEVFADPCADAPGATTALDATPGAFVGYLQGVAGVTGTGPTEVEVGGRPGVQVDLTFDYEAACPDGQGSRLWLFPIPVHGDLHSDDGERDRVVAVDSGSGLVTIWMGVTSPESDLDHILEHGTELMDTMTIGPLE